jgi:hypothetical protein
MLNLEGPLPMEAAILVAAIQTLITMRLSTQKEL